MLTVKGIGYSVGAFCLQKEGIKMQIIEKSIADIRPYENNPRNNEAAIQYVANSIKDFGFKVPIVIDKNGTIITGHTRVLAAKKLGMKTVPCILADDLTPEQVKAFRLADNKVSEMADWNWAKLEKELDSLGNLDWDMSSLGFDMQFDEANEDFNSFFEPASPKGSQQVIQKETTAEAENNVGNENQDAEIEKSAKSFVCPHCGKVIEL